MPYNSKQYDAAIDFLPLVDPNIQNAHDARRVAVYDLYENIYRNATFTLKLVLRGDDQSPILMPNGKKIIEATHRFLGQNVGYLVEAQGDESAQQEVDAYWKDIWKREEISTKFSSNLRWGLTRGDFCFYVYGEPQKVAGRRICIEELDPRYVFEIEDHPNDPQECTGLHIVDLVHDFREPDKPEKMIARRRTFRKQYDETDSVTGITSELTHWEIGKWDDRSPDVAAKQEKVNYPEVDEPEELLPAPITQLPVYKWSNDKMQNSSWGTSLLAGLETLLYAINQTLSDEEATIVFQGLGMYVTDAAPPIDPTTGDVTDWNIGPKQIIEISSGQTFERVTGINSIDPFRDHMNFINDGMAEASGTPQTAIGRVDVTVAQSGISLKLELMPLIAANKDRELVLINVMDQLLNDVTTMWLPAYESEQFGNIEVMTQMSVVCVFDDPMPRDHDAEVQEIIQLDTANLILKSMAVAKLRELGWKYPTTDDQGNPLTDDDIAGMLLNQVQQFSSAIDPFANAQGGFDQNGNPVDAQGNPIDPSLLDQQQQGNNQPPNAPSAHTIDLGTTS